VENFQQAQFDICPSGFAGKKRLGNDEIETISLKNEKRNADAVDDLGAAQIHEPSSEGAKERSPTAQAVGYPKIGITSPKGAKESTPNSKTYDYRKFVRNIFPAHLVVFF
jgi:hypothetical protein